MHDTQRLKPVLAANIAQEAILFLQRLASLARAGWTRGPLHARWEATFLDLIHTLCTARNLPQARAPASAFTWGLAH